MSCDHHFDGELQKYKDLNQPCTSRIDQTNDTEDNDTQAWSLAGY